MHTDLYKAFFDARLYLSHFFAGKVTEDEQAIFRHLYSFLRGKYYTNAIDFGCGPTIHHAFTIAPFTQNIDLADYSISSLKEVSAWAGAAREAFDWDQYLAQVMTYEDGAPHSSEELTGRKELLRKKVVRIIRADISKSEPLVEKIRYDLVASFFCVEAATDDKSLWKEYLSNLISIIKPGGDLFLTTIARASVYKEGGTEFRNISLTESDLQEALSGKLENIITKSFPVKDALESGYESIMITTARKPTLTQISY